LLRLRESINREKAAVVERHCPRGRLLDVGCQRGDFLEHMRQRAWGVQGVELSDAVPTLPGLDIRRGSLSAASFPANSFDVVTLWSVIEHLPDPGEHLREVSRVLRPGGTLVLLTTNYESIPSGLLKLEDVPRHLVLFTRRTLRLMLARHGFLLKRLACSDRISRNSAYGLLQYLLARARGRKALETFYRMHFATNFAPPRGASERLERLRQMGLAKGLLVASDRALAILLDSVALVLGAYGAILAIARKPDDARDGPLSAPRN